jgi:hypothetical protein
MLFSTLLVMWAASQVLIVGIIWRGGLQLIGPVQLNYAAFILTLLGIFLPIFIFWIAVLIVMNKPSVKSFFRPTQDMPEKKS